MKKIIISLISTVISFNLLSPVYAEDIVKTDANNIVKTEKVALNKGVAVLDFENNTGVASYDNLKKAMSDALTNGLAKYQNLNIVERTRLKDAVEELKLGQSGFISQESAIKIGKTTGSQYVVLGSLSKISDTFELSTRVVDIESSKIVSAKSIRCYEEEMFLKAIDYLAMETADSLGEKISKNEVLSRLRNDIENYRKGSLNWLYWVGGAALLAGAGVATYVVIKNNQKNQTVTPKPCLPPNCTINNPIINNPIIKKNFVDLDLNGLNFNFTF
ncbi:MAG: CsgG/HfaB family protein [Candidatus Sericytochromatia bacterium]